MVMVGQQRRLAQPLRWGPRERWAVGVAVAVLCAGVIALLLVAALGGRSDAGCIDATFAGYTGAATLHACGPQARAACTQGPPAYVGTAGHALAAACRRAGYATVPTP
jgi:hypothetical protein